MKIFKTIMALLALFALMVPCAHAEEHHHHELPGAELCAVDHATCHACSDEPCADNPDVASIVSTAAIPAPQLDVLFELKPEPCSFKAIVVPCGDLLHLQSVVLLI